MSRQRSAQISIEFLLVAGFSVLLLVLFLVVTTYQLKTATTDATITGMQDIADSAQLELLTAKSVGDGYNRTFSVPQSLQGRPVSILLQADGTTSAVVTVSTAGRDISVRTPYCNGTLTTGMNRIGTANGVIRCNG